MPLLQFLHVLFTATYCMTALLVTLCSDEPWIAYPESVVVGFVPAIEGLPSYHAETVQATIEESRTMLGHKVS